MKLAVTTAAPDLETPIPVALLAGDFSDRMHKAAAMGYDAIELLVRDPVRLSAESVIAVVHAVGLEVAAIASGAQAAAERLTLMAADGRVRLQAQRRLLELIDFAQVVGAPLVTVGSFRGRLASQSGGARQWLTEVLYGAAVHAEARGIRLALEPLNRYETDVVTNTVEGLALIEEVGHSHLGLLIDTFHANIEEPSIVEAMRQAFATGRLWHVHLADSNRLAPGQGHIDFAEIVAALHVIGYQGYLSAELLAKPDADAAASATIEHMRLHVPTVKRSTI